MGIERRATTFHFYSYLLAPEVCDSFGQAKSCNSHWMRSNILRTAWWDSTSRNLRLDHRQPAKSCMHSSLNKKRCNMYSYGFEASTRNLFRNVTSRCLLFFAPFFLSTSFLLTHRLISFKIFQKQLTAWTFLNNNLNSTADTSSLLQNSRISCQANAASSHCLPVVCTGPLPWICNMHIEVPGTISWIVYGYIPVEWSHTYFGGMQLPGSWWGY